MCVCVCVCVCACVRACVRVCVGLTVSLVKSKSMVVGAGADVGLLSPIPIGDGFIDVVEDFQYLGT